MEVDKRSEVVNNGRRRPRYIVGIDPGKTGAIAIVNDSGSYRAAFAMPDSYEEILEILRRVPYTSTRAVIEHVWSQPGQGHTGAFAFGKGYGALLMALTATKIKTSHVTPARWQRSIMRGRTSGGDKRVTRDFAGQLFSMKVTHTIADALLIAEYGRRIYCRPQRRG